MRERQGHSAVSTGGPYRASPAGEDRPAVFRHWPRAPFLLGFLAVMTVGMGSGFVEATVVTTIECRRTTSSSVVCDTTHDRWTGTRVMHVKVAGATGARVIERGEHGRSYLVLTRLGDEVALTEGLNQGPAEMEEARAELDQFVDIPWRARAQVRFGSRFRMFGLYLVPFGLFGIMIWVLADRIHVTVYRRARLVTVRRRVKPFRTQEETMPLDSIVGVEVETAGSKGDARRVCLIRTGGERVPLTQSYYGSKMDKVAARLRAVVLPEER